MKLKLDKDGHVVVDDSGNPIYVHDDGKEVPFDAMSAMNKIASLNKESADRRHEIKSLNTTLETFKGIEDPEAAIKALDTVSNLDAKKLVDAGEIETLKRQMNETYDAKEKSLTDQFTARELELTTNITTKDSTIFNLMVESQFARSPWFSGEKPKTILPPDMASTYFGKHFKVEGEGDDLKVIGYLNGETIHSREKFGEPASFEEALEVIIDQYPMKEKIMAANPGSGPGVKGNTDFSKGNGTLIDPGDKDAFAGNIEKIANGEVKVATE